MSEPNRERILRALIAEESPLRDEGARLAVDHFLAQPLTEIVALEQVTDLVVSALTEVNVARFIEGHVEPGFRRYAAAAETSGTAIGALVPDEAKARIHDIVRRSKVAPGAWARGLVDPALIRRLFAPVWVQLLLNFGTRLPLPGMGAASGAAAAVGRGMGGIAGRLTRSVQDRAEKIADAGRSVMGGIGAEVEKRIQAAARDFSDGAAEIFRDALLDRLKSPEGANLVEQIAEQMTDRVMLAKLGEIQKDVDAIDVAGIFDVVPKIVAHAVDGDFLQGLVKAEVAAFVALEGRRTLSEVLSEMGVLTEVRRTALERSSSVARGLFATPEFAEFLGRLLDA